MAPYSYSKLATYRQCPAKYNFAYNLKLPRKPRHEAAVRGEDVHKSIEEYLRGEREDLHIDIMQHQGFFQQLRDMGAIPEVQFAVNREWEVCGWDDDDCYIRGYIDTQLILDDSVTQYEYKSGKMYPEHKSQMNLYATCKLVELETEAINSIAFYLDLNDYSQITYPKAMLKEYKGMWNRQIRDIENDKIWMKNPTWLCRYCDFSTQNGGPCPF